VTRTGAPILAIDQGTTNTKVLLVGPRGGIVAEGAAPASPTFPRPAWVEQDPMALWDSVLWALEACLAQPGASVPAALAITNQRESVLLWERSTGEPLGPVVSWQCRRSGEICQRLRDEGREPFLFERTGLTIDPLFSASKARWLLDRLPDGRARAGAGEICFGTVDSWLLWRLTGGRVHRCDVTNASRTQLFDLHTLQWDDELLDVFGLARAMLPEVLPSSAIYGETVALPGLPAGVPIAAAIGDSHAALFGQGGHHPGSIKATYGTGSSLMMPMPRPVRSRRGLSTTVAWGTGRVTYALEGNIAVAGAAVQWVADLLGLDAFGRAADLALEVDDSAGVVLVPAFVGLGAPHWRQDARGILTGLTRGTGAAHVARAALESIAFQVADVFDAMAAEAEVPLARLLADGGASRNDWLMQFQADLLGIPVVRDDAGELSAIGAAHLAGLAVGTWASEAELASLRRSTTTFEPRAPEDDRVERREAWRRAVAQCLA
jgi:glycerol kinase